jgi:acetoin utilization protein AcuB
MNLAAKTPTPEGGRESGWLVERWMSSPPVALGPEATIKDALEAMSEHRIRHVPVVEGGRLVGIVSDRDTRHALPLRTPHPEPDVTHLGRLLAIPLGSIMTRNPITIDRGATIRDAAEVICREKIGALPVVEDGRLLGIISAEDLLWAFLENTAESCLPAGAPAPLLRAALG